MTNAGGFSIGSTSTGRGTKRRSLLPREHGAYAQLGFPVATALALGGLDPAALLLTAAIACAFLLHEPALVLTGGRGGRVRREEGDRARRRALVLLGLSLVAGAAGLWLASQSARLAALASAVLGLSLVPLILTRREKTTGGELLVALTAASTTAPVALAGGARPASALIGGGAWAVVFVLSTLTVRATIVRAKRKVQAPWLPVLSASLSVVATVAAVGLALREAFPSLAALAVVPTALLALMIALTGVHPRHLRRLGWSLVASYSLALAALVIGLT